MANTSTITGSVKPNSHVKPGTPLTLKVAFTLNPTGGLLPGTLSSVIVQLPPQAVDNGALFPSCTPETINAVSGSGKNCPKGSRIGKGDIRADVWAVDNLRNVPASIEFYNGPGGKSLTMLVHVIRPARVNVAFKAPLVRTHGRYGYKLTAPIPDILQDLQGAGGGWYPAVRKLSATVGTTMKVRGRTRGYIEAKRCPKSGKVPLAGTFNFKDLDTSTPAQPGTDNAATTAQGMITCKP
jgi:hypothetical protein